VLTAADERPAARDLLRGALVPVAVVGAVGTVVSLADSGAAMAGSLLATAIAAVVFGLPPTIMTVVGKWSPPAVMAFAVMGHVVLASALGVLYLALDDATWLSHSHLGWTLLACTVAATVGLVVSAGRLRVLVYDDRGAGQVPPGVDRGPETP